MIFQSSIHFICVHPPHLQLKLLNNLLIRVLLIKERKRHTVLLEADSQLS